MKSTWALSKAKSTDAGSIASLLAQSWTSPFTRLQFGNVGPVALATAMSPAIAQQIQQQSQTFFVVARDSESSRITAVVQYSITIPDTLPTPYQTVEETEELLEFEDEAYRHCLPEDSNKDVIMEFTRSSRDLKHRVLQGQQEHVVLENVATHPDHRRRGMASQLVDWVIRCANEHHRPIYLNTERDNPVMNMYKKLGFEEVGTCTVSKLDRFVSKEELEKCMFGSSCLTLVALIREPDFEAEQLAVRSRSMS
ncbi:hypothetical protein NX059_007989 [Plenodomus lindquistii]|nr:hypothetical protein NX059_007989 [Plenodomus lindquistii]